MSSQLSRKLSGSRNSQLVTCFKLRLRLFTKNTTFGQKNSTQTFLKLSHMILSPQKKSTFNFRDMKVCLPQLVRPSQLKLRVGGCCSKASEVAFIRGSTSQVGLWTSNQRSLSEAKCSSLAAKDEGGDQREKQKSVGLRGLGWAGGLGHTCPTFLELSYLSGGSYLPICPQSEAPPTFPGL